MGRCARRKSRRPLTSWAFPRRERKFLAGVKAQFESEVVYGSLQEDLGKQGVIFTDTDTAVREHPDSCPRVLWQDHSPGRQQVCRPQLGRLVGRIVHLRAARREDRVPAAGLLPHQCRADGPIRTDADHRRRRRRGALRRRLHRPDVLHREPPLGGRRDHRQEETAAAATRRSRTGPTTSTTWSPSGPWPTKIR